jgi:hypothetical protein
MSFTVNSREEFRNTLHLPQPSQGSEMDTESDHTDNGHHNQNESDSKSRVDHEKGLQCNAYESNKMTPTNIQHRIEKNDISYSNERHYRSKSIPSMYKYMHMYI